MTTDPSGTAGPAAATATPTPPEATTPPAPPAPPRPPDTGDDSSGSPAAATANLPDHSSATIDGVDVAAVLKQVQPAVVSVQTKSLSVGSLLAPKVQEGAGTGSIVSSDGKIVTNDHVVDGAQQVQVTLSDGSSKSAKVLGADPNADLAVLKIDGTNLPTVTLGNSDDVAVGDPVVAIGNALALQGGPTVTEGIVSALNRTISDDPADLAALAGRTARLTGTRLSTVFLVDEAVAL